MSYKDEVREASGNFYWTLPRFAVAALCTILVVGALGFVGNAMGLLSLKFWGVKTANVQTQIFHQTQQYIDGKNQDIAQEKFMYDTATDEKTKSAIRYEVITMASDVADINELNPTNRAFVQQMREGN